MTSEHGIFYLSSDTVYSILYTMYSMNLLLYDRYIKVIYSILYTVYGTNVNNLVLFLSTHPHISLIHSALLAKKPII